ncbi:ABC transporter permease [Anaerosacchariphilus sp. NSJ-68]|uniref:ABC transporter permease n=2 Tax=Lachnospiraceae TaxID=186803 RepID=A0A923LB09_9FIRM|nr:MULTISPECIES: FtsX-like permease family protein [Lachnospiraceae]MBC5658895.1 ABC transporter permease [Anaerosacchariphilus hominis]MBC5698836.1 ABC transporter permease [Roseburia difficilis]
MSFSDLLKMSLSSLWRRKLRTVLTVLGVVVGTASIMVMISLGLGLSKSNMEQIEQYGGLTTITVYPNENGGGMHYGGGGTAMSAESGMSGSADNEPIRINDAMIKTLSEIDHVEIASPVLSTSAIAKYGKWEAYLNIQGMSKEALQKLNLELTEGSELPLSDSELKFLYGNTVITDFYDAKTNQYYWDTGQLADIDYMKDPLFIIFDTDAYWNSKNGGKDENGTPVAAPKKYLIPACGVMAGTENDYTENSNNVLCDVEALKMQLKKIYKGKAIPGQPTTKSGKPYKEIYYDSAYIRVDDMKNVKEVQTAIQNLGLQANSNAEWMEQVQQSSRSIQATLGGIGAVSLFVAAIGIANTMMMSIYERTKEIGVMKVLGCDMAAIRNMFLAEAGFIGLIGGVVGVMLSYIISAVINFVVRESYANISYIPPYLTLLALIFAVVIGMLAGLFPALRAMRLSPLAAIRNE